MKLTMAFINDSQYVRSGAMYIFARCFILKFQKRFLVNDFLISVRLTV